jgi:hypothetical protein
METVGGEFGINREFNPSGILAIVLEKSEFAGLQKIELLLSSYTDGSSTEYLISADFGDSGGSVNTSTVCIYFPVAISFDTIKEKLEKLKKSWKK